MNLKDGERLDDLGLDGLKIIQHEDKYCFTSDAVFLANFVNAKKSDHVVEIGGGSGIISILVAKKCNPKHIDTFEIQPYLADMSKRSVELNNMTDKISIHNLKIQKFREVLGFDNVDIVMSNPPYKKLGSSFLNLIPEIAIARHELKLNLKKLVSLTDKMLKFGGKFYVVYDANRTAELIYELKKKKIEPKRMFFTQPAQDKKPTLVLIEAVKGGKSGVTILPTLITNNQDGEFIQTIQKLYKEQ